MPLALSTPLKFLKDHLPLVKRYNKLLLPLKHIEMVARVSIKVPKSTAKQLVVLVTPC
jgi:hypothetical protein